MERQLTLKDKLNEIKTRFIDISDPETFKKEVSFAMQHIDRNPQLKKCTIESKQQAVLNVAQVGLSLNPVLKLAYLVPRSENVGGQWVVKCHLEPSYQGLCKLVTDTGSAKSIQAHIVYDGDLFDVQLGTETKLIHKPRYESTEMKLVYMVATLADNSKMIEIMQLSEIEDIRERSESYKAFKKGKLQTCVWVSDFGEMARKTVLRRGVKYLPKSEQFDKLAQAISLDESDYQATVNQINLIETLLNNCSIDHDEQDSIYGELSTMSAERAREVIAHLQDNQLDPISSGKNYSQQDIVNKIKSEN